MTEPDPDPLQLTVSGLLDQVAAPTPAPGAGAVAATVVAFAAGLTAMSAGLSRRQMPEAEEFARRAVELQQQAAPLGRRDAEAYAGVLAAQSLPADDPRRPEAVRTSLQDASDVPLEMARIGVVVSALADDVARRGNPNLKGDALTGALLARAAVRSAVLLVELNLRHYPDDKRMAEAHDLQLRARSHGQAEPD